jgi:two-component system, OmpR family, response regulator
MHNGLPVILARHPLRNCEHLWPMFSDWLNIRIVGTAQSEVEAAEVVESLGRSWNLLIVEPVLSSGTGLGVVKSVRKHHDQFVLVLGSQLTSRMRAKCLSLGADAVFDESTELSAFFRFCATACLMLNCDGVLRDEDFRKSLLDLVKLEDGPETLGKALDRAGSRRWRRAGRAMPWPRTTSVDTHSTNSRAGKKDFRNRYDCPLQLGATTVTIDAVEDGGLAASLARQLRAISDSGEAAALIVATIASLCRSLNPAIGKFGVDAMFARSVRLAAHGHPWMRGLQDRDAVAPDLAALKSILEAQDVLETCKAGNAILRSLNHLLSGMIGLRVSGEMLRQATSNWAQ